MGPSTLSRLETGGRRLATDHLVALAKALDTTVDELLLTDEEQDVVISPRRDQAGGATYWLLTRPEDPLERTAVEMRLPERKGLPEARTHPRRDWFYVLSGVVRLGLGDRELLIAAGKAASFDTMTPHKDGRAQRARRDPEHPRPPRSASAPPRRLALAGRSEVTPSLI